MTDTQIYRIEVGQIMAARAASRDQFMPLLRRAIVVGVFAIFATLLAIAGVAMTITGQLWPGYPIEGATRTVVALIALALFVSAVGAWIRHARIPGEIMELPGYTKAEFQRLTELNRKIRAQVK